MPINLKKYLAFADAIDADVAEAQAEADAAFTASQQAAMAYDQAVDTLKSLTDVQKMARKIKADTVKASADGIPTL